MCGMACSEESKRVNNSDDETEKKTIGKTQNELGKWKNMIRNEKTTDG